uniref:Transposase n=1 Tax=Heterorhabditis bacteriophora TaxID=37862 RepID=A0A1I7WJU4_HETBA
MRELREENARLQRQIKGGGDEKKKNV